MFSRLSNFINVLRYFASLYSRILRISWPTKLVYRVLYRRRELNLIISATRNIAVTEDSSVPFLLGAPKNMVPDNSPHRFGLLLRKFVSRSKRDVESDMYFAYSQSLTDIGHTYSDMSALLTLESTESTTVTRIIHEHVDAGIEHVILDGNCFLMDRFGLLEKIKRIKRKSLGIIVDIPDCYQSKEGYSRMLEWTKYADVVVVHNSRLHVPSSVQNILLWPGFPFPELKYESKWSNKTKDFSILGYEHRQREIFARKAATLGLLSFNFLHSNKQLENVRSSYIDYIAQLKEVRMTFSNGYINSRESIIVGRALESMLCNTLLLYENGSDLDFFFSPYSDYIQIYSLADFVEKSTFLMNNLTYAEQIATHGFRTYRNKYNSRKFWENVLKILS